MSDISDRLIVTARYLDYENATMAANVREGSKEITRLRELVQAKDEALREMLGERPAHEWREVYERAKTALDKE